MIESAWRPPNVADLPSWAGAKRIGFDFETCDPHLKELGPGVRRDDSYVIGFSYAIEDGPSAYVPLFHEGGDNVEDPQMALRWLRDQAKEFDGIVVGQNLQYEIDWCTSIDVVWPKIKRWRDLMVAAPLINELEFKYDLTSICERAGLPGKDETLLRQAAEEYGVDPKSGMWKLPARFVGPYGDADAVVPLPVLRRLEREIEEQELQEVYDLESDVLPILAKMRSRGIRVHQGRLEEIEHWALEEEAKTLAEIKHLTGVKIDVGDTMKARLCAPALEAVGVKVPFTMTTPKKAVPKRRYSIDADFLDSIAHPVAERLKLARKMAKLRTTYAASIRKHMVNGRVHPTYNQLRRTREFGESVGAAYGRLSGENPNIQNQPSRDEFSARWRAIYLPEEGSLFGVNDYSQQEPRIFVHWAKKTYPGERSTRAAVQRYLDDPTTDNHQMMAELAGIERGPAKELFLGKIYGMGGAKICHKLGLPTRWVCFGRGGDKNVYFETKAKAEEFDGGKVWEVAGREGQQIINRFDSYLPFVYLMSKTAELRARKVGYIRTLSGRRCRFPRSKKRNGYDWTYRALNRLVQGSAADQTKKALVDVDRAGHFIQLQVHDEIDGSFPDVDAMRDAAHIMERTYRLSVPFRVTTKAGPSWGECKGVD